MSIQGLQTGVSELGSDYFNEITQSVPGAVAIIEDESFAILSINNRFEKIFGYTLTEVSDKNILFTDLLNPTQKERFINHINESVKKGNSNYIVCKITNKTGGVCSFYIYASYVNYRAQIYKQYFFLLLMPNASKFEVPFWSFESREVYMEQLCNDDFGMFEWILEKNIVYISDNVNIILDINKEITEVIPGFISSFIHPNDLQKYNAAKENVVLTGKNCDIELRIITGINNIKTISFSIRTFSNNANQITKIEGCLRDITKQKTIEQNYINKVEELNNSNNELEEFAYIASHDLQEPLRKISTFTGRLAAKYKDQLQGEGAMYIERTIASAENMRLLINDLLEFSRISKTIQPFTEIDLNSILRLVKTDLDLIIEETHTKIESMHLPVVECINSQLKQVFTNIISNAIKFRKKELTPIIKIETCVVSKIEIAALGLLQNNIYHKISFTDNGIGFEEQYAKRIFQVFQRLHGKAEYPGTGIGLAICKKIIEYHHGLIYAESTKGEGSCFVIIFPKSQ